MTKEITSGFVIAVDIMAKHGSAMTTSETIAAGIHPRTLYQMRDAGIITQLARGLYCLNNEHSISSDIAIVSAKYPKAVICLISALSFHELTTQIPHSVSIALPKGTTTPRLIYPPITVYRFSENTFSEGVENHIIDNVSVKIYSIEKTLADCFKFRNKIGMDIVLEALKRYKNRKDFNINELMKYAKICRVERVMKPYIEASI